MARFQFSLLRLLGAVTCFAVAFGEASIVANSRPSKLDFLWFFLIVGICCVAAGGLCKRVWVGLVAFLAIMFVVPFVAAAIRFAR